MTRPVHPLVRHAALLVLLLGAGLAQAAPFLGRVVQQVGEVRLLSAAGQAVDLRAAGNRVREAETISTGPDGRAVVSFNNGTITVLDPNSRLRVRTPNWFVHLAGKAFFGFKKLFGGDDRRRVQNTVALIGIRGTTFISYADTAPAVALKEGRLSLEALEDAFEVLREGVGETRREFLLEQEELVTFDGNLASVTGFTPQVLADFAAFEAFGGTLLNDFIEDYTPGAPAAAAAQAEPALAGTRPEERPERGRPGGLGLYLGAGAGVGVSGTTGQEIRTRLTNAGHAVSTVSFDDQSEVGRLFGGYYFTDNVGVEAGYANLGQLSSSITVNSPGAQFGQDVVNLHPVSAEGPYVAGVLRLNLLLFSVYGKAGLYAWKGDVNAAVPGGTPGSATREGTDPVLGAGVDFRLGAIGLRAEAERYTLDKDDLTVVSGNLVLWF